MKKCKFCGKEFNHGLQLGVHIVSCQKNPKSLSTKLKAKKSNQKYLNSKHGKLILKEKKCQSCNTLFKVEEREFKEKEKYFCSRSCANRRIWSKKDKEKKSLAAKNSKKVEAANSARIESEIRLCTICKKKFSVKPYRNTKTCGSKKCVSKQLSQSLQGKTGGYRTKSGRSKFHGGYYKNIWMDSSWEIKVAKNLDKSNISWIRNEEIGLTYHDQTGKKRKYIPDFYLPKLDLYLEVKGYWTDKVKDKIDRSLKENNIKIFFIDSKDLLDTFINYI